jgi:hypothetical protein
VRQQNPGKPGAMWVWPLVFGGRAKGRGLNSHSPRLAGVDVRTPPTLPGDYHIARALQGMMITSPGLARDDADRSEIGGGNAAAAR